MVLIIFNKNNMQRTIARHNKWKTYDDLAYKKQQ